MLTRFCRPWFARLLAWQGRLTALILLVAATYALGACGLGVPVDLTALDDASQQDPNRATGNTQGTGGTSGGNVATAALGPNDLVITGSLGSQGSAMVVVCSTAGVPVQQGSSATDANGNFSVTVQNGVNQLLGCSLVDNTNLLLANFTFQNDATSLEGNAQVAHEVAFASSPDWGQVAWDESTFEVVVYDTTSVPKRSAPATNSSDVLDVAGVWQVSPVDFPLPPGTTNVCSVSTNGNCLSAVRDTDLWQIWRYDGTRTNSSTPIQALQAWYRPTQGKACGQVLGMSTATLSKASLAFTSPSSASTTFNYTQPTVTWNNVFDGLATDTSSVSNNYQLADRAISRNAVYRCYPYAFNTNQLVQGWACGPDGNNNFRFSGGLGCTVTSTGEPSTTLPVALDWPALSKARCTVASSRNTGLTTYTCPVTPASNSSVPLTCTAVVGDFHYPGFSPVTTPPYFSSSNLELLTTVNALCHNVGTGGTNTITDYSATTVQASCYASFLHDSGVEDAQNICLPQTNINAADGNAATQLVRDFRPKWLRHADLLQPLPGAQQATLSSRKQATLSAWAASPYFDSTPIACPVVTTRSLSLSRISATRLLATVTEQTGTDDLRPACLATYATGARRTMAYLDLKP